MTILTFNKKELEDKIGKITPGVEEKITDMGTPVENVTDKELSVEVFPNRPDLLSIQNFSRAINQFNGKGGVAKFNINNPEKNYSVVIEKSVKKVRPYTVCAIVKRLKFDDKDIKEIIEIQEKLHNSIGRKRKKIAIGIYPLEKIKLPIRFIAKNPEEIKFQPLESQKELTGKQILRGHPAGKEHAHLLENANVFPIFIDADRKILSMPPIINSEETGRITKNTREIFIECSGDNLHYLKKCLNILASTFSEMGGKIYAMEVEDPKEGKFTSPNMDFEELSFEIKNIEKTLGIKLNEKDVKKYLEKMGIGYSNKKGNSVALIPPYRMDILHWVDLSEEIAIAYGYKNFIPEIPEISTIAEEDPKEKTKKVISKILAGLGLIETSSFHITTKKNIKKMHFDYKDFIEIEESKTEMNTLRMDLLTNALQILSENSNSTYPQKIFEIGTVFSRDDSEESETGVKETENLSISLIDESVNFTELKQILDYLFKMLNKEYKIENTENSNYISGRTGKIFVEGKEIGYIGEIAPRVLKNWKIRMPVTALEINLNFLFK
jgi:phenylalanyl-tRNA synthetase beta chain|tara:strand:- start:148 stop:1803 length:1656 start_codon:yes stop_codon:yes gene_type:complete